MYLLEHERVSNPPFSQMVDFGCPLDEGKGVSGYNTVCLTMHHYRKYDYKAIRYLHIKNLFSRFKKIHE
jgi:hypothetical protein